MSKLAAEFGDTYRFENLLLSATHTHSGPAGFLQEPILRISISAENFSRQFLLKNFGH
jgi:hypothetical protein